MGLSLTHMQEKLQQTLSHRLPQRLVKHQQDVNCGRLNSRDGVGSSAVPHTVTLPQKFGRLMQV